eukprot:3899211-Rhodomonas_salina.1
MTGRRPRRNNSSKNTRTQEGKPRVQGKKSAKATLEPCTPVCDEHEDWGVRSRRLPFGSDDVILALQPAHAPLDGRLSLPPA